MSTALAVLALTSLGVGDEAVRLARLHLTDVMVPAGRWATGIPFYSTMVIPQERFPAGVLARLMLGERQGQLAWVKGEVHSVSLYVDRHHMVTTALAMLSLAQPDLPVEGDTALPIRGQEGCHPRYRCEDPVEYIVGYALPPYIRG